jgi:hypothetical protein
MDHGIGFYKNMSLKKTFRVVVKKISPNKRLSIVQSLWQKKLFKIQGVKVL